MVGIIIVVLLILVVIFGVFIFLINENKAQNKKEIKTDTQTMQQSLPVTQKKLEDQQAQESVTNQELAAPLSVGASTPEQTISLTATGLKNNDPQKFLEEFIISDHPKMKKSFDSLSQNGRNNLADALLRAEVVEKTDDEIIYKTTMDDGDGNQVETNFVLFKQAGVWKFLYL